MSLNEQLWVEAEKLAARDYDVETFRDSLTNGEIVVLAKHPELPGCMAHGSTLDDALSRLKEARTEYIYSLLIDGLPVPFPRIVATVTQDAAGFDQTIVVGLGSSSHRNDTIDADEDIAFSYRGDYVERS